MTYLLTHFWPGGTEEQYRAVLAVVHPQDGLPVGQISHADWDQPLRRGAGRGRTGRGARAPGGLRDPRARRRRRAPRLPFVRDAAGEFRDAYGDAGAHVIRPDGYVGYRAAVADAGHLRAYLGRLFAPS